jgi:hypothetical protein
MLLHRELYKIQVALLLRLCYECLAALNRYNALGTGEVHLNSEEVKAIQEVVRHFTDANKVGAHISETDIVVKTVNRVIQKSTVTAIPGFSQVFVGKGLFAMIKELIQLELQDPNYRHSKEVELFPSVVVKALDFEGTETKIPVIVDLTGSTVKDGLKISKCEEDLCNSIFTIPGALWSPSFLRIFGDYLPDGGNDIQMTGKTTATETSMLEANQTAVFKSLKWEKIVTIATSSMFNIKNGNDANDTASSVSNRILAIGANVIHLVNTAVADICTHFFSNLDSEAAEENLQAIVSYVSILKMTVEQIPKESFQKSSTGGHTARSDKDLHFQLLEDIFAKSFVKGLFDILLPRDEGARIKWATPEMQVMANAALQTGLILFPHFASSFVSFFVYASFNKKFVSFDIFLAAISHLMSTCIYICLLQHANYTVISFGNWEVTLRQRLHA